ncbi:uncharacterized protein BCR38DRAFT_17523 [Pseudomassariella vexata]|uniref:Secreted protein n=1 Tax=Pseudomassariella vexata TaxID=1141098 RepID=A0A1Y2ELE2_9PEZI|nr:uncharacterized protein BCR38DRAFT_17523 [Pseudomassariella vexata]ORY71675.1 hypothetical protein BCR38DRAFT_17523 [Pseudomassariella vexata]
MCLFSFLLHTYLLTPSQDQAFGEVAWKTCIAHRGVCHASLSFGAVSGGIFDTTYTFFVVSIASSSVMRKKIFVLCLLMYYRCINCTGATRWEFCLDNVRRNCQSAACGFQAWATKERQFCHYRRVTANGELYLIVMDARRPPD